MTWLLDGATRDAQSITSEWEFTQQRLIDGVFVREIRSVPKSNGVLTEITRPEWLGENERIGQVFQIELLPGGLSAWHAHEKTTDRLFVSRGLTRIVLFDNREESPTRGLVNEHRFGSARHALVLVPPRIWHGVQNIGDEPSCILNLVDTPYDYEAPDHWRVPADSDQIPYRFPNMIPGR